MFCKKCGKSIPDDSKFCSYCGELIIEENNDKDHGFCSECGEPLPNGKIIGVCDKCKNKQTGFYKPYSVMPKGTYHAEPDNKEKGSKGRTQAFVACVCVVCVFFFAISLFSHSSNSSTASALTSSESEILQLKNQSQTAAIAWAMENMQQYGKISDQKFTNGIDGGKFIADFKFRSPNVYGTNEQHELIMQYSKNSNGWELSVLDFDGQIITANSKAAG